MDGFDLDRATEVGWAGFLSRLADHLGALGEPLRILPYGGDAQTSPVLEVTSEEGDPASAEGNGSQDAVLHAVLRGPGGSSWPEDERAEHLTHLGWHPDGTAYLMDLPRSHAHLLAAVVTDTLREVVGVPHPAFLDAGALTLSVPSEDTQVEAPVPELDIDTAVMVQTPAELRDIVDTTLHTMLAHPPRHDHDGDVPILFGSALVYVRTADAQPVVTIFAIPVQDIRDLAAARREVELFNRRAVFGTFRLVGRQIIASVAIPCLPFVPRHLIGMVELMGREIDNLDEDLAARVRGRRWIDLISGTDPFVPGAEADASDASTATGQHDRTVNPPLEEGDAPDGGPVPAPGTTSSGEDAGLPPELAALLELDAAGGPLDPALVAEVCHHDRQLILRLIRITEEQTLTWRAAVREAGSNGDADGARSATQEMRSWQATLRELRAALRHVVTFGSQE